MIFGVGTDIIRIERIHQALTRHGARFANRILTEDEYKQWQHSSDQTRFLAKRFAAKEAFGKALGTGVAVPATLHAIAVSHDERGKPFFCYSDVLMAYLAERNLLAHLSLSDEVDYAVAFVILEQADKLRL